MGFTSPAWILYRKRENSFLSRNHSIGNHKIYSVITWLSEALFPFFNVAKQYSFTFS